MFVFICRYITFLLLVSSLFFSASFPRLHSHLTSPISLFSSSHFSIPPSLLLRLPSSLSCLSSPLSARILINLHPPLSLLLSISSFLFLKKLIFPINFLCLNSLSSSLSMTHRLYPPPPLHPSIPSLSRASFIWKASTVARVLPLSLTLSMLLPSSLIPHPSFSFPPSLFYPFPYKMLIRPHQRPPTRFPSLPQAQL